MPQKNSSAAKDISGSFFILSSIVFSIVIFFVLIENIVLYFQTSLNVELAFFIFIGVGFMVLFAKFRKDFVKTFSSIRFAIVILFFLLIASVIGTLVIQNETPENYNKVYSSGVYSILKFLKFTDIFHSFWFASLLILLCVNILFCVLKRDIFNRRQFGFFLNS